MYIYTYVICYMFKNKNLYSVNREEDDVYVVHKNVLWMRRLVYPKDLPGMHTFLVPR